jgi:hypothetical protein
MKTLADKFKGKGNAWADVYKELSVWDDGKSLERAIREDPCRVMYPLMPDIDPWQREVMNSDHIQTMLLCTRQGGKSSVIAAMALAEAIKHPHAEILLLSRSLRQSVELLRKVKELWRGLTGGRVLRRQSWKPKTIVEEVREDDAAIQKEGWDAAALSGSYELSGVKEKALTHEFPNRARITSLPGNPDTIVGFSAVTLLIIDEAARVPDNLLSVARPFLTVTEQVHGRPGRLVAASTPFGKRGWFWEAYNKTMEARAKGEKEYWKIIQVTAEQCPRISKEFLAQERAELGEMWFNQEYGCSFLSSVNSVFSHDLIHAMVKDTQEPLKLWFE